MSFLNRILLGLFLTSSSFVWADQTVSVAWDASPDSTVVGYWVYYGPAPDNYTNKLDAGSALTFTTPPLSDGTYYFTATARNSSGVESDYANVISTNISTTVPATPPSVVSQPASTTANVGSSASFSVTATGSAPLTYQWLFNDSAISGATTSTYTITSVNTTSAGNYSCVVSNSAGSARSGYAILIVPVPATAPSLVSGPASTTANVGSSASFSVSATGSAPLTYQWLFNGTAIAGATASTYTISSVQPSNAGSYSCLVSNPAGSATAAAAVLTVNVPVIPPSVVSQPASVSATVGASASFTISATGSAPLTYQWLFNDSAISGATASTCTISSVTTNNAGAYSCVVSNSAGFARSGYAVLTVLVPVTPPSIVSQPASLIVDPGATASFSVTAAGSTPLAYQWFVNGNAIPGATASSYNVDSVQPNNIGVYSCSASNSAGAVTSSGATLAFGTYLLSQPSDQTINATSNLLLTVSVGGTTDNVYQWSKNGSAISGATNATYSLSSALASDAGTYTVSVTGNRTIVSSPAVVTVLDPVFYLQPVSKALVVGQSYTFTAAATGTQPLRYQWYVVKSGTTSLLVDQTNTSLTLSSIKTSDSGAYYCVANNGNYVQSSNAVLSVLGMAGTYNGLFADTANVSNASSGSLLNFVVTSNGTYSGKIDIEGSSYSLSGTFNSATTSSNLVSRSKGDVVVLLWFDSPAGTISGNVSCAAEQWSVPLRAQATGYSASNPVQASGNNVNFVDLSNGVAGHASITNTVAGAVKMSGKLSESTRISINTALTITDEFPVHVDLYRHTGTLHGWVTMTNRVPGGTLMWIKRGVPNKTLNVVVQP